MNNIRKLRRKRGLTQKELAGKMGISQPHISKFEHGRIKPWPKAMRNLTNVLEASEEDLYPRGWGKPTTCNLAKRSNHDH